MPLVSMKKAAAAARKRKSAVKTPASSAKRTKRPRKMIIESSSEGSDCDDDGEGPGATQPSAGDDDDDDELSPTGPVARATIGSTTSAVRPAAAVPLFALALPRVAAAIAAPSAAATTTTVAVASPFCAPGRLPTSPSAANQAARVAAPMTARTQPAAAAAATPVAAATPAAHAAAFANTRATPTAASAAAVTVHSCTADMHHDAGDAPVDNMHDGTADFSSPDGESDDDFFTARDDRGASPDHDDAASHGQADGSVWHPGLITPPTPAALAIIEGADGVAEFRRMHSSAKSAPTLLQLAKKSGFKVPVTIWKSVATKVANAHGVGNIKDILTAHFPSLPEELKSEIRSVSRAMLPDSTPGAKYFRECLMSAYFSNQYSEKMKKLSPEKVLLRAKRAHAHSKNKSLAARIRTKLLTENPGIDPASAEYVRLWHDNFDAEFIRDPTTIPNDAIRNKADFINHVRAMRATGARPCAPAQRNTRNNADYYRF